MKKIILLVFIWTSFVHAQYPDNPTSNIPWNSGETTIQDIQKAFNYGREQESLQLGISLPMITLPLSSKWDIMSDNEKALWIINEERIARGVTKFSGISEEASEIAGNYAKYLGDNDVFGHSEDGKSPWERLDTNPTIAACNDGSQVVENLNVAASSSGFPKFSVVKAIYGWIYNDKSSAWGHRHACLRSDFKDNGGIQNEEGLIGIGKAEVRNYKGPFSNRWDYVTIVVYNVFDPCATWNYNTDIPKDVVAPSAPANLTITNVSHAEANIKWDVSTDNVGVAGYKVYVNGIENVTVATTTASLKNLTPETAYEVYVTAYDKAGNVSEISTKANFTTNMAPDCTEIVVAITFDNYASETSWEIKNKNEQVVLSGSGYQDNTSDISKTTCLEEGVYTFTINDSYGDGICCTYGEGSYKVTLNGIALVSGATFTSSESKEFTIGKTLPPPIPLNLVASDVKSNTMILSWEVQGDLTDFTTFEIYNGSEIIKSVNGIKITTLNELTPETIYNLSVRAKNVKGDLSEFSNTINISTLKGNDNGISDEMLELFALVNQARTAGGKQPLKINTKLTAAAEFHANDMNDNNFFSHTGSNGSNAAERIDAQGYDWNSYGENIAHGQRSAQEVHDTWMNSEIHRGNILDSDYTEIGLARVANLWVQVFGRSSNSSFSYDNAMSVNRSAEQQLDMYPTLLSGDQNQVNIVGNTDSTVYKVYNMAGRIMQQGTIKNASIEMDDLLSGVYLVNFIMNNKTITKRLVRM
ncbi:CAP domain-containing protein [Aquimarina longa]|uniref:CAP domain-containing protein n=1 Tax=Aquimarina longa TaxID=1080221 RepID=UPI000783CF31|nr:CAP domain-containing protein [Aquimarina longa]